MLARRGEFDQGRRLVEEAVEMLRTSDELDSKGNLLVDLAEVRLLGGQPEEAVPALEEAIQLFEAKGNVVSTNRAESVWPRIAPGNPVSPIAQ